MIRYFLGFATGIFLAPWLPDDFWRQAVISIADNFEGLAHFIKSLV